MNPSTALEGLKTALQTELNGIEFYRLAAQNTDDTKGKRTFQMLADDELKHFKTLQQEYVALAKNNGWQKVELGEPPVFEGDSPIFSKEMKERIKGKHFEMTALSIGALLESNSIDFYRNMKETSTDPAAKELYGRLQQWEESHLEAITRQLDLLKEDYWAEQRFSPLF
ncbi:ferritin family protein [candidate division WOR-3 bacterium]|nr:ferritin family protein [candidate division WOR-3 bacterium]